MVPIVSLQLLPNGNSDVVKKSMVRASSFDSSIWDL